MQDRIPSVLEAVAKDIAVTRRFPESTYRLQFHAGFTFRDALHIVPYLHALGITHCYASPFLQARPGSTHGYDITSHQALNPEIGTAADYEALCETLQAHAMGQVLDIVPNHMGIIGNGNLWWNDILENGPASPYAMFFDIAWDVSPRAELHDKVLLPILGELYGHALESQQIRLAYVAGTFSLHYFEHDLPVAPCSYEKILGYRRDELLRLLADDESSLAEFESILSAVTHLSRRSDTDPARVAERQREKEVIKRRLATLTETCPHVREFIAQNVLRFNGTLGDPHSFDLLDDLLSDQAYRLSNWRVASDEINYRRFFDVNELAALSIDHPEVFAAVHALIFRLLDEGKVHGLRIDHVDGLYDPQQYMQRLQQHVLLSRMQGLMVSEPTFPTLMGHNGETLLLQAIDQMSARDQDLLRRPLYLVAEKILGTGEALPDDWPIHGTSGYDFLNVVNGLFIDADSRQTLTRFYRDWIQDFRPFADVVYEAKRLILQVSLSGELHMLAYQLDRLAQKNRWSRDFTLNNLRHALQEVIACFPVYRSYISETGLHPSDRMSVKWAVARAERKSPTLSRALFGFVRDMLLLEYSASASEEDRGEQQRFVGKFQQVTSPVMAKGREDTAFYIYNRLLSLNEVGGDPDRFGISIEEVHRANQERHAKWPYALSPLSTHDTKRGEDVRARLNVLSELPEEWQVCLTRWSGLNEQYRQHLDDEPVPDANEEYLLYQTLLGAWPLDPYTAAEYAEFVTRMQAYMLKALHEAKLHTSWVNPHPTYDEAVQHYVGQILDAQTNGAFLDDFRAFQRRVSHYGLFNSLAQTLLKITSPGVPDTYQGTEIWDFSLVDPDNRRPVDYARRSRMLQQLQTSLAAAGEDRRALARQLLRTKEDGLIKLYITWLALNYRRAHPGLFSAGKYVPMPAIGAKRAHVFAFARCRGAEAAIVIVPRLFARLLPAEQDLPLGEVAWQDTSVLLEGIDPHQGWRHLLTGEPITFRVQEDGPSLAIAAVLRHFPVALLAAGEKRRDAV
jgi:(1->4)-alpha-D-glucan 1-alpha-D-glucosylmutase